MKTLLTFEQDLREYNEPLPNEARVVYFKMVGIGPNTLSECQYLGSNIYNKTQGLPGFFIISDNLDEIRKTMHDFVDRFCDAQNGEKNESKIT